MANPTHARHPMSSYAVQMRAMERRLLTAALAEVDGDLDAAADLLGIHRTYLRARCTYLGGVTDDHKHEPPIAEARELFQIERRKEERQERARKRGVCCQRYIVGEDIHDPACVHYRAPQVMATVGQVVVVDSVDARIGAGDFPGDLSPPPESPEPDDDADEIHEESPHA